jgi:hypothetical protein
VKINASKDTQTAAMQELLALGPVGGEG